VYLTSSNFIAPAGIPFNPFNLSICILNYKIKTICISFHYIGTEAEPSMDYSFYYQETEADPSATIRYDYVILSQGMN
jgi:hypothetical protein